MKENCVVKSEATLYSVVFFNETNPFISSNHNTPTSLPQADRRYFRIRHLVLIHICRQAFSLPGHLYAYMY